MGLSNSLAAAPSILTPIKPAEHDALTQFLGTKLATPKLQSLHESSRRQAPEEDRISASSQTRQIFSSYAGKKERLAKIFPDAVKPAHLDSEIVARVDGPKARHNSLAVGSNHTPSQKSARIGILEAYGPSNKSRTPASSTKMPAVEASMSPRMLEKSLPDV